LSHWQSRARAASTVLPWYVVLRVPRAVLHHRIQVRAEEMVRRGLIEEVAAVLADGVSPGAAGLDGVGIREAVEYLQGQRDRSTVAAAVAAASRQYAKRQETWFRHQLHGPALILDATRPAEEIAAEVARGWDIVRSELGDTEEEGR
jgi:tRNA dimethylallyltransferase